MNTRSRLRACMIVTAALTALFIFIVFLFVSVISSAHEQQKASEKIAELSFQLSLLRSEFVQLPGDRPLSQWTSVFASMQQLLNEQPVSTIESEDQLLVSGLRTSTNLRKKIFEELVRNIDQSKDAALIRELNNQLSVQAQSGTANALLLAELSRKRADKTIRELATVTIFLGLLVLAVNAGLYLLSENIASSLIGTNRFLDAIIENIPDMIFLKDAGRLRFVQFNSAGEELLGYNRKDLIGKNDYDFFPKEQADFFTEKDRSVLQSRSIVDIPCEAIQTRNRGERLLHTKKIAIRNTKGEAQYLLGISEDITEQRKQEDDLRKYQMAVESSTDGIIITDARTDILYVNPAWCTINGYCPKDVVGKPVSILKTEKTDARIFAGLRDAMRAGGSYRSDEFINRRKDESEYNADLTIYPVRGIGTADAQYWVGILTDVTERKRSDRAKSEFVSLASHQLRTPLSVLRLVIDTLLNGMKGTLTPGQKMLVVGAQDYAKRMAETINTLLSVSLSDEGKIPLSITDASIADILRSVHKESAEECRDKGIRCSIECPQQLTARTDRTLLTEVIENLVTNAIRYTPKRGTVTVRARGGDNVTIEVQDNGIGIPQNAQEYIFHKFFRAENAMKMSSDGTGLGLYLVHSFVTLLGGTITVQSEENKGSTFTMVLPASPPSPR